MDPGANRSVLGTAAAQPNPELVGFGLICGILGCSSKSDIGRIAMGTIILIIAFIVEAAFATYCIVTKSNQRQIRNFMRIGALVFCPRNTLT